MFKDNELWNERYGEWLSRLIKGCGREDCPCYARLGDAVDCGVIPRGTAGHVNGPDVVIIGIRPGPIHPIEAHFYKMLLKCEWSCGESNDQLVPKNFAQAVKFAADFMYGFICEECEKYFRQSSPYVRKVRKLVKELLSEGIRVYLTNFVKCQAKGHKCGSEERLAPQCKAFLEEELHIVLGDDLSSARYLLLSKRDKDPFLREMLTDITNAEPLIVPHPRSGGSDEAWVEEAKKALGVN